MSYLLKYSTWRKLTESTLAIGDPEKAAQDFSKILKSNYLVKEEPKGSNKGPEVSGYLTKAGVSPGNPWCMAFVYSMFDELSQALGISNPLPKTAGVMNHWGKADPNLKIGINEARQKPELVKPGQIFIMSRPGQGKGHTGIVVSVDLANKSFKAIEGNTNDQLSGEGNRVGINKRNLDASYMVGFIDYFKGNRTAAFENIISTTLTSQKTDYSPVEKPDEKTSSSSGTHSSLLKLGASGEEVSKVQMKLGLTPTGKYDEATRDAVRSFQSDPSHKDASGNSLVPDGIVGPRTREAMFGSSHSTVKSSATTQVSQENVKVGTHSTISVPPGAKGQVPVFVFYPGIAVNGKIGREYMPPLIKAAVPDWYSKYVIVIPNQHTTPWDNVKTEIDAALSQAGISQKNISIGVFSGSGNNSANISSKVKEIRPRNFIVMDPTPGANLTNSIKSLGSSSNIIMMYNPSNWGNAGYYVGGISNLEGAVSSAGTLDKVSTGHMTIPKEILTKYKSQIERNV